MSVFDEFLQEVLDGTRDAAGLLAEDFLKDTTAEGTAFKQQAEENLLRWKDQLANGELDAELLQSLVRGEWDMAVLAALAKAGKSGADAQALAGKVLDTAISAAFKILL